MSGISKASDLISVRCCVAGQGGDGPDLWFVQVRCTREQIDHGQHYEAVENWVVDSYLVDASPLIVFDEFDPGKAVLGLFQWETADTIDIQGEVIVRGS